MKENILRRFWKKVELLRNGKVMKKEDKMSLNTDDFPYKAKTFSPENFTDEWKEKVFVGVDEEGASTFTLPPAFTWNFLGVENVFIQSKEPLYDDIDKLTDYFTEKARVKANVKAFPSPFDWWQQNKNEIRRKYRSNHDQREAIYSSTKEATQFKISATYALLRYLDAKIVLDPSAGWGDRILGAAFAGVEVYHGVDPNTALVPGYQEIIRTYQLDPEKFSLTTEDFLKVEIIGQYDTVFTSPPYFDYEIYSSETTQSILKKDTFNNWVERFYRPYLTKAYQALIPGGRICLYASDNSKIKGLSKAGLDILEDLGAEWWGVIGIKYSKSTVVYPIWIWRKPIE